MGPLGGDLGYFPVSSPLCCVQHNLHTSFVYSLRRLLMLPCAFTAIYILRVIALGFVTEMSQILKDRDAFVYWSNGFAVNIWVRWPKRLGVLCGCTATAVSSSHFRTKSDLTALSLAENENTVEGYRNLLFCTSTWALWKRQWAEREQNKAILWHKVTWLKFLPFSI